MYFILHSSPGTFASTTAILQHRTKLTSMNDPAYIAVLASRRYHSRDPMIAQDLSYCKTRKLVFDLTATKNMDPKPSFT